MWSSLQLYIPDVRVQTIFRFSKGADPPKFCAAQ